MSRTVALNALFLMAGCSSEAYDAIAYRLAVIVIVLMLYALWVRAVVGRTATNALNQTEHTLDLILTNWNETSDAHPGKL